MYEIPPFATFHFILQIREIAKLQNLTKFEFKNLLFCSPKARAHKKAAAEHFNLMFSRK